MSVERSRDESRSAIQTPQPANREPAISAWFSAADGAAEGGDWCDAVVRSDGIIALTIGDVSGHGAPVAESMRAVRTVVLDALRFVRDPSDVLASANKFVIDRLDGHLVTAIVALIDQDRRILRYANAGHPPPLLLTDDRTSWLWRSPADLPFGVFPRYKAQTHSVDLPAESLLLFYTDGITEHDRDGLRGEAELVEVAGSVYDSRDGDDARAIAEAILMNSRGLDDAATMVVRSRPSASDYERNI